MDSKKRRDVVISLIFVATTWILYTVSLIDNPGTVPIHELESSVAWEPAPFRMNFIFDSDGPRVIYALVGKAGYYAEKYSHRHPLFILFLAPVMKALLSLGVSAVLSGLIISAFFGAAAVGVSYLTLRKWRVGRTSAGVWTALFAVSTPIWLISSVSDSFSANALCVVTVFCLTGPQLAQPRRYPVYFAGYLLFSILAIGLTLAYVVYVAAGFVAGWWINRKWSLERLAAPVILLLGIVSSIAGLAALQDQLYPATANIRFITSSHSRNMKVGWDAGPEALSVGLQTLGPDALIFRGPEIGMVPSPFYPAPGRMIVFGARGILYWCSLLALAGVLGFAGFLAIRSGRLEPHFPRHIRLLALGFILYNIVFAYSFRGYHGAPVLFAVHVVFPIILLLASFTSVAARDKRFVASVIAATLLITWTNALSMMETRRLVNRPCAEWAAEPSYPAHWWPTCKTWE